MTIRYATSVALAILFLPHVSMAQLSFGGRPNGLDRTSGLPEAPVAVMPPIDLEAIAARDERTVASGAKGPYWFGYNHEVDLGLDNSGIWQTLSNGDRVWRLGIECPEAYSINFEFHEFVIPDGAQVFVYNEADEVLGAFEANSNPGQHQLGVDLLAGDRITIEYVEPARVAGRGRLRVGQVTHGYRDLFGQDRALGESGSCNNNVICPLGDPWRDQIRSVAMIVVQGGGICTGQLMNNCQNDGTPYFLTANHCLGGTNWVFRFNWNSPVCTPTQNGPMNQSISGFTLLANSGGSDVALLRLNATPPEQYNVFYSGWDRSTSAATSVTAIHHPSGDIKKISVENQAVVSSTYSGAQTWRVQSWDDGTTEGGSSGSGLWNQNGLLVGQLFGGQASCDFNFNDYYGKFSTSYPVLDEWLGACGDQLEGLNGLDVGIRTWLTEERLSVVPNPTNGNAVVTLPSSGDGVFDIRVLDAVGRVVEQHKVSRGTTRMVLDLAGQPEGIYLVEATSKGLRSMERLVIVH